MAVAQDGFPKLGDALCDLFVWFGLGFLLVSARNLRRWRMGSIEESFVDRLNHGVESGGSFVAAQGGGYTLSMKVA